MVEGHANTVNHNSTARAGERVDALCDGEFPGVNRVGMEGAKSPTSLTQAGLHTRSCTGQRCVNGTSVASSPTAALGNRP